MSSTVQCIESSKFRVKNIEEVQEVLETLGLDVYVKGDNIQFFGDENSWFDDSAEVVLSLKPIEGKNLLGVISDYVENPVNLDYYEEGSYIVQDITEYVQDQLLEGEHISITCVTFTSRCCGNSEPFGDITVITKNDVKFGSLLKLEEEFLKGV